MFPHRTGENGLGLVPWSLFWMEFESGAHVYISEFDRRTGQSLLEIQLNTFTHHGSDPLLEPQEDQHLDIEVPLIAVSEAPIEHVQVIQFDSSFGVTDQLFGFVQCNTSAANVSPTAPSIQLNKRRHESVLHYTGCKVPRAAATTRGEATVQAALPWCLLFI